MPTSAGTSSQPQAERVPGRPRQFSHEQIVQAALEVMEDEGFAALTISAMARKLKISHSALYKYISNIEDLEAEALHLLISQIPLPRPGSAAQVREQLLTCLTVLREVLRKHPGVSHPPVGSRAQKMFEEGSVQWVAMLTPFAADAQAAYLAYVTLIGAVAVIADADRSYSAADFARLQQSRDKRLPPLLPLHEALGRIVDINIPGLAQPTSGAGQT